MKTMCIGGLNLSEIILGSDQFGTHIPLDTALRLLDIYYENGGRTIDTARAYGGRYGRPGASECVIGLWLKSRNVASDMVVITKGGHPAYEDFTASRISFDCIREDIEKSREALGLERLPLYFLHRDNPVLTPNNVALLMRDVMETGAVGRYGLSNWHCHRIAQVLTATNDLGITGPVVSEIQWSILRSTPQLYGDETLVFMNEAELSWYRHTALPVLVYGAQAKGFVAKTIRGGVESNSKKAIARYSSPENHLRIEKIREACFRMGLTPSQFVLAYIRKGPLMNALPIVGCSNTAQLQDSLSYMDIAHNDFNLSDFCES